MKAIWLTLGIACGAHAQEVLNRADNDPIPTFKVNGARTAVGSNLTFLAGPIGQPPIRLNQPILLTINPRASTEAVLKGPLQARLFRLDGNEMRPRPWGRAKPNNAANLAGAKADCLVYLTTVLTIYRQSGSNKDQFALDPLTSRGWLTPDVAANKFLQTRYLVVFETQNDGNGIFRVEEGPAIQRYFDQGSVITLDVDAGPVKPGEAVAVAAEGLTSTRKLVELASKTGADVECKTAGVHIVNVDGSTTVAIGPCEAGTDTTIEMISPG